MLKKIWRSLRFSYFAVFCIEAIKHGSFPKNSNFEIREAGGKGQGLFAKRPFKRGDLVFIATGPIRFAHFEGEDCYKHPDWYSIAKDTWVDIQYPFIKTNHSCNPNLGISNGRAFVALRDINIGEELGFDYSFTDDELEWVMNKDLCLCNESNCRSWIRAAQLVPQEYFLLSYPYISDYFVELYVKEHPALLKQSTNRYQLEENKSI